MTDPLSITFGVVGVAAVVLHSTRRLREFIDSIEGVPKIVSRLSVDISAIENILEIIDSKVKSPKSARNRGFAQMIQLLEGPLRNCEGVLKVISGELRPYPKVGNDPKLSKWRSFTWTYREKDFQDLQALLISYKTTLEIAFSAATLMNTTSGFQDLHHHIQKLRYQIDAGDDSIEFRRSLQSTGTY